jgi:hypothetical protein
MENINGCSKNRLSPIYLPIEERKIDQFNQRE